jgi:hypothetical protein
MKEPDWAFAAGVLQTLKKITTRATNFLTRFFTSAYISLRHA